MPYYKEHEIELTKLSIKKFFLARHNSVYELPSITGNSDKGMGELIFGASIILFSPSPQAVSVKTNDKIMEKMKIFLTLDSPIKKRP